MTRQKNKKRLTDGLEKVYRGRLGRPDMRFVSPLIELAVAEDYGKGDVTTELTVPADQIDRAYLVAREEMVVCGMAIVPEILHRYDRKLKLKVLVPDGYRANVAQKIGVIEGPLRGMLSAERVILNFLQRLSGVATMTWKYVSAIRGTKAKIYDTRKTTPGWRELEKYAVRCGGGYNHRMNLGEAVMFKDNHLVDMGSHLTERLRELVAKARQNPQVKYVVVEVDHVDDQLDHVLQVPGVDIILLDNMGQWQLKHAVQMRNRMCGRYPLLEASGGVTLNNVLAIASCGVDRIAVGAITHSAVAVDIGLDR